MPVFAREAFGSAADLGLLYGTFGGFALAGSLAFSAVGHRLPKRLTFVCCFSIAPFAYLTLATVPSFPIALAALGERDEALRIAREAGVGLQISHHKAAGRFNWGKTKKTLRMVEDARAQGIDVHSDVYPYTAGSTVLSAIFVPLWAFEGSQQQLMARLSDPDTRARSVRVPRLA